MAYFKVGGQLSFITVIRANKDADLVDIQSRAIRKAWREGAMYCDASSVDRCTKDGEELESANMGRVNRK